MIENAQPIVHNKPDGIWENGYIKSNSPSHFAGKSVYGEQIKEWVTLPIVDPDYNYH